MQFKIAIIPLLATAFGVVAVPTPDGTLAARARAVVCPASFNLLGIEGDNSLSPFCCARRVVGPSLLACFGSQPKDGKPCPADKPEIACCTSETVEGTKVFCNYPTA